MQIAASPRLSSQFVLDEPQALALLLQAVGQGDTRAFERLYRSVAPCLRRYATRLMHGSGHPDEVMQESFLAIWNGARRYDALRAPPMVWLRTIVRHQVVDTFRRRAARLPAVWGEFDDCVLASDAPQPCQQADTAQQLRALGGWLDCLGAEQRHAIELTWFQELSHSQAAAHMNKPLGTVKTLVRRGLIALRAQSDGATAARPR